MTKEELDSYIEVLKKDYSYNTQEWLRKKNMTYLDEYISNLTEEEKDALFILVIMKFTNLFKEREDEEGGEPL